MHVADNGLHFIDDNGRPFFYLADTVWSAFTHAKEDEWNRYLKYRRTQGFNALQINILPQYDASGPGLGYEPFAVNRDGLYDTTNPDDQYFSRAERMIKSAVDHGFVPALVVLWSNYVPGTWLSEIKPGRVLSEAGLVPYVKHVVQRFMKYRPLYIISGDTSDSDLHIPEAWRYYSKALSIVREVDREALTTFHLWGPETGRYDLPEEFLKNRDVSFYMYQSGHAFEWISNPYNLPKFFRKNSRSLPIVNGEPCYEGIGHSRGRHDSRSVRRAIWLSLLSGASAGITYGAHGIWCWHTGEEVFESWGDTGFGVPFLWEDALRFPGAWDAAFARWLFEEYSLFDLEPADFSVGSSEESAAAVGDNACIIYLSYPYEVKINANLSAYEWQLIDLTSPGRVIRPDVQYRSGTYRFAMPRFNSDAVLLGTKH